MTEPSIEIVTFEYHVRSGVGIGGPGQDDPLWYAVVRVDGMTAHFSRHRSEGRWYCDALFGANGYPHFCHGEGSRCCQKQYATGELERLLTARKIEWGDRPPVAVQGAA